MTVKQISVFLENKPGQLAEFAKLLEKNKIDMRALHVAETRDFGVLRVIVDDTYKAVCILKEAGYICSITPVLAVVIPDEPGGLSKVLTALGEYQINLEYTYVIITRNKDFAYMIIRVEDNEKAEEALTKYGIEMVDQEALREL